MQDFLRSLPRVNYPLSPLDIVPSHLYISNCFFFQGIGHTSNILLEKKLQNGLYDALQKYPILVGELRPNGLNTMHIAVNPDKPNLPRWETMESDIHFQDLKEHGFQRDKWPEYFDISEPLLDNDGSQPAKLLQVRLCHFADGSGVAIIMRIAHAVFDAKGVVGFINHWAKCCQSQTSYCSMPEPIMDRNTMYEHLPTTVQPKPLNWLLWPLSYLFIGLLSILAFFRKKHLTFGDSQSHLFAISRYKLDQIRVQAKVSGQSISDNDAIVALFTMAYAQITASGNSSKSVRAIIPCDFRHRLDIPEAYTGNCAVGLFVTAPLAKLTQPITCKSITDVALFCRKEVDKADDTVVTKLIVRAMQSIRLLGSKARVLYSLMVCQAFSNQSRLNFYTVDFGFGKPSLAVPLAYPRTLAVVVPSPPDCDDIYIWLALQTSEMEALQENKQFQSFVRVLY